MQPNAAQWHLSPGSIVHSLFGKHKNDSTLLLGCQRRHLAPGKDSERLGSDCDGCVGLRAHVMLFA
jgi:hypothetical protein